MQVYNNHIKDEIQDSRKINVFCCYCCSLFKNHHLHCRRRLVIHFIIQIILFFPFFSFDWSFNAKNLSFYLAWYICVNRTYIAINSSIGTHTHQQIGIFIFIIIIIITIIIIQQWYHSEWKLKKISMIQTNW